MPSGLHFSSHLPSLPPSLPPLLKHVLDTVPHLLSEGDKKWLMHQLLKGTEFMHARWYLHRDLKVSPSLRPSLPPSLPPFLLLSFSADLPLPPFLLLSFSAD